MAKFDPDHILNLAYHPINVRQTYSVDVSQLKNGHEDRNLNHPRKRRVFSFGWSVADLCIHTTISDAFDRAFGPHEGFYLCHEFFPDLIPVRFNSDFNYDVKNELCGCDWEIEIQNIELIEVFDADPISKL